MEDDLFAGHFKLDVTIHGDRSRQVSFASDPRQGIRNKRIVTIWTRERFLADNVYVERTNAGDVRVVKQVLYRPANLGNTLSELRAMGSLSKENAFFVQLIGWFQSTEHVCFAMEYCPLGDISLCFEGPLSEALTRTIGKQVAEGLAKLHEMKIIHRDIKPQNILVLQRDPIWVKISDFGISKRVLDGQTELRTRSGTEGYVAPEVFGLLDDDSESSSYTSAVDVWSLGCLLHYLLTRKPPFSTLAVLRDYCWDGGSGFPEGELAAHRVGVPGRELIRSLLALEPGNRPEASSSIEMLARWRTEDGIRGKLPRPCYGEARPSPSQTTLVDGNNQGGFQDEPFDRGNPMDYHTLELWQAVDEDTNFARFIALLEQGANANKERIGHTAVHRVAKLGSPAQLDALLDYDADVNRKTKTYADTPLHLATHQRSFQKMLSLVNRGADVNAQNSDNDTALHLAIARGCDTNILEMLVGRGASLEIKGRNGRTALQYAIALDQENKAGLLLGKGADPNTQDVDGRTPLHDSVASHRSSLDFIRQLVAAGADVSREESNRRTPLHEAVQGGKQDAICFLADQNADYQLRYPELERAVKWALLWRDPFNWASIRRSIGNSERLSI